MNESLRDKIIKEIILTEKTYLQQLHTLDKVSMKDEKKRKFKVMFVVDYLTHDRMHDVSYLFESVFVTMNSESGILYMYFLSVCLYNDGM